MTVALVTTVRDEEVLLRHNLRYHHFLGVDLCFVYSDGSTDGTVESVASLPFVQCGPSLAADAAPAGPELARAITHLASHTTARQVVNMADAIERARAAGCAWLLAIDADELACVDPDRAEPGALRILLAGLPADVECVRLPTLEVVQLDRPYANVFAEQTLFKRGGAPIRRRVRDPLRGGSVPARGFYGHTTGKVAVRLSAAVVPRTPHRFTRPDGSPLATATAGHLLHYYCHDFPSFVAKFRRFRDHPDVHLWNAPVEPLKRLWRDVVNHEGLTPDDLRAYYRRWVAFDERRVRRLGRARWFGLVPRRPAFVEVTSPRQAFAALEVASAAARA